MTGKELRQKRIEHDLSSRQMADKLGINQSQYSFLERQVDSLLAKASEIVAKLEEK